MMDTLRASFSKIRPPFSIFKKVSSPIFRSQSCSIDMPVSVAEYA